MNKETKKNEQMKRIWTKRRLILVSKQISTKLTKKQASKQTKSDGMDIME
jgi:hypothetical protein